MTDPHPQLLAATEANFDVPKIAQKFIEDLKLYDDAQMVQRHIAYGSCIHLDSDTYYKLKRAISLKWGVHHSKVIVVGSAKLGFSIAPSKRYKPFGDDSDIDVAIVSSALFDEFWHSAHSYASDPINLWDKKASFIKYIFRGWVRPDMLPISDNFPLRREWVEFFNEMTISRDFGDYPITGGIYKDWHFFEKYQQGAVTDCRNGG